MHTTAVTVIHYFLSMWFIYIYLSFSFIYKRPLLKL